MRPLEAPKKKCKPLLQRMAEDKAAQLERGSLMGSQYFTVQLPDGSYEKRLKVPVNVDPGVHSSFDLDEVIFDYTTVPEFDLILFFISLFFPSHFVSCQELTLPPACRPSAKLKAILPTAMLPSPRRKRKTNK